ncbi:hypothetical protein SPRG_10559 [Saprolegnia parasitica CBS 223.65]|uniref:No apical meristem-associated C-terminal domain-containing protein n=1 Tax=Saprolegnia parasitica (strain CBS 223.65) TaxID=695850 RepID=A0A067CBF3_SAPPC|nr:hypothetical protein SPRG_10559 [Saprolegnia parasitica CBS 223.65]KDO24132.1 hypothetical protein SPRG_10559 [Saprolegnia parasitica CBS 223.65]|eukprot:XP_012205079.1 hypothetical protein SPRG_10559 [Saprolegnia parasitica CBS 223.65]
MERDRFWQHKQDVRVVKAIVRTTLDPDLGAGVTNDADFWRCVHNDSIFSGWLPRDVRQIWLSEYPDRWRAIQPDLRRFTECYTPVQSNGDASEKQDAINAALARFKSDSSGRRDFEYLEVWRWLQESAERIRDVVPRICAIAPGVQGLMHSLQQCMLPLVPQKRRLKLKVAASTQPMKKPKVARADCQTSKLDVLKRRNELLKAHNQLLRQVAGVQKTLADEAATALFADAPSDERDAFFALQRRVIMGRLQKHGRDLDSVAV